MTTLREALDKISELSNHGIPGYACGNSEAAIEMGNRLETIWHVTEELRAALAAEQTCNYPYCKCPTENACLQGKACPDCGKPLGSAGDIHTCSPQVDP